MLCDKMQDGGIDFYFLFSGDKNSKILIIMKAKSLLFLLCLSVFLFDCSGNEEAEEKKTEPFEELPPDIIASKPCSTLYQGIMQMYPEHKRNHETYTVLFEPTTLKQIVLKTDSEVYATFISEGAGWSNTFGYYTYDRNNPPGSPKDITKHVLFPNVTDAVLNSGDMLKLGNGKFKAGTVIGFFLIPRGYENGLVHYTKTTHYTDLQFNKNGYQQHILFKEGECGDIVLAFEDRALDLQDCDFDYNDIIMTVADNKDQLETVAFDLTNLVVLTP
jgi:hypothetical protein